MSRAPLKKKTVADSPARLSAQSPTADTVEHRLDDCTDIFGAVSRQCPPFAVDLNYWRST